MFHAMTFPSLGGGWLRRSSKFKVYLSGLWFGVILDIPSVIRGYAGCSPHLRDKKNAENGHGLRDLMITIGTKLGISLSSGQDTKESTRFLGGSPYLQ